MRGEPFKGRHSCPRLKTMTRIDEKPERLGRTAFLFTAVIPTLNRCETLNLQGDWPWKCKACAKDPNDGVQSGVFFTSSSQSSDDSFIGVPLSE